MTLEFKISLMNDLIKEMPDITVGEYSEVIQEIENIEKGYPMPNPGISAQKREDIIKMAATMTPTEIQAETKLAFCTIYAALRKAGYKTKAVYETRRLMREHEERIRQQEEEKERRKKIEEFNGQPSSVKRAFKRPAAVYSNHSPYGIATELHQNKTA